MKKLKDIAVLILFFEKIEQTIECVNSFLPSKVHIYILNNGSSSQSSEILRDTLFDNSQITIFHSEENLGVSRGRNFLIEHTTEEWLFFVDNDIVIKNENWLSILKAKILQYPMTDVFIPKLYNIHNKIFNDCLRVNLIENKISLTSTIEEDKINIFPGGASVIHRTLFKKLGGYDKRIFLEFEDYEFAIRAIYSEKKIQIKKLDFLLYHEHKLSFNKQNRDSTFIRYNKECASDSKRIIEEKYNIIFEHGYETWIDVQIDRINGFSINKEHTIIDLMAHYGLSEKTILLLNNYLLDSKQCNMKCMKEIHEIHKKLLMRTENTLLAFDSANIISKKMGNSFLAFAHLNLTHWWYYRKSPFYKSMDISFNIKAKTFLRAIKWTIFSKVGKND